MGIYSIKPAFRRALSGLLPWLRPFHPDVLTWAALVCAIASGVLFSVAPAHSWPLFVIPVLLFVRTALNALDGMLAEVTGKARVSGEVLNEATDRAADIAILLGLSYSPLASLRWGAPAIVAVLFSSYVGILGKAVGVGRQYGGVLGKADRMLWLGIACVLASFTGNFEVMRLGDNPIRLFDFVLILFFVLACVTSLQRLARIRAALAGSSP